MPVPTPTVDQLNEAARRLVSEARQVFLGSSRGAAQGVNHWLKPLLDFWPGLVKLLTPGTDQAELTGLVARALAGGEEGPELAVNDLLEAAAARVTDRPPGLAELAMVVLERAGATVNPDPTALAAWCAQYDRPPRPRARPAAPGEAVHTTDRAQTRALDAFGEDLTATAAAGGLSPVVGRDPELDLMIEVLCRRTKCNPVLIGPPGVGKTALVEALAQRIASGNVPEQLRGRRLISLPIGSLNAGSSLQGMHVGELEGRIKQLLDESEATKAIWFIDELHMVVGAGSSSVDPQSGLNNLLKPALSRGALALVGATTELEYRRYIETDAAFERRLQPLSISEMSPEATYHVLRALRDHQAKESATVSDEVLISLTSFAQRYMPNRYLPDKAVDLLDQAISHAVTHGLAEVDVPTAEAVAQRVVGFPGQVSERLAALEDRLVTTGLLAADEAARLRQRLAVTIPGMDLRPVRPNAVLLLTDHAGLQAESIGRALAEAVYGDAARVISVGLGAIAAGGWDALYGSPQWDGTLTETPIQRLSHQPWSVVLLNQLDQCPPIVQLTLAGAMSDGYLTLPSGKRLYLSNAIVLLSAAVAEQHEGAIGFRHLDEPFETSVNVEKWVEPALLNCIDLVVSGSASDGRSVATWLQQFLLPAFARRYEQEGLLLVCEPSFIEWLAAQDDEIEAVAGWERLLEAEVTSLLLDHRPTPGQQVTLRVFADTDGPQVAPA